MYRRSRKRICKSLERVWTPWLMCTSWSLQTIYMLRLETLLAKILWKTIIGCLTLSTMLIILKFYRSLQDPPYISIAHTNKHFYVRMIIGLTKTTIILQRNNTSSSFRWCFKCSCLTIILGGNGTREILSIFSALCKMA